MNTTIIIVLTLILLFLIILNHVSITLSSNNAQQTQTNGVQGKCSQTAYGCCPDGVNSKIDFNGTNCPAYNPGPGYKV
jgi:hypothetical protein